VKKALANTEPSTGHISDMVSWPDAVRSWELNGHADVARRLPLMAARKRDLRPDHI
jgi:hypothetical protein